MRISRPLFDGSRGILMLLAVGLLLRLVVLGLAPRYGYPWDHFDNIGMGRTASADLLHVYSVAKEDLATVHGLVWKRGIPETIDRKAIILPNYPPLAIAIFLVQGKFLELVQTPPTANTFMARAVMASVPIAFEWILALAVGAMAARLFGEKKRRLATALAWLFPPIFMNSCLWGQVDAFFMTPSVIMCVCILDGRWRAAGISAGLAALLKPQGLLLLPIATLGLLLSEPPPDRREPALRLRRSLEFLGVGAATVLVVSAPWMLADGLSWFRRTYVTSFLNAFPDTTLYAFNIWYADLLRLDGRPVLAIDSRATILGLSKDTWGRLLFVGATIAIIVYCLRRARPRPAAFIYGAGMILWSAFMFPTRVHERFILYGVPFLLALAVGTRRLRIALLALLIVGVAEQSWNLWMSGPPAGSLVNRPRVQARLAKLVAERDPAASPISPHPTEVDAVESLARDVRPAIPEYRQARRATRALEILWTVLSIVGFAAAVAGRPRALSPGGGSRPDGRGSKIGVPR